MSTHSGKNGTIKFAGSQITPITNWTCVDRVELHKHHDNTTGEAYTHIAGIKDSSGSFQMSDKPGFYVGQAGELVQYDDEEIGTVSVIIEEISPTNVDIAGGTPGAWAVTWKPTSELVWTTGSYT